jgi:heme-degrading monooxygenase HmoA
MFTRVSTYRGGDAEALVAGFQSATDALEKIDGFSHAYFLVDRESGKGMSITFWQTEEALDTSSAQADELRKRASEAGGATVESVERYDIALYTSSPDTVDGRTYRHHEKGGRQLAHGE